MLATRMRQAAAGQQKASAIISSVVATPADSTANSATHTFSSIAWGDAASDRVLAALIFTTGNGAEPTITNVTFGGVAGAEQAEASATRISPAEGLTVALWSKLQTTGTSGNVVVTTSVAIGSNRYLKLILIRMVGGDGATAGATATDQDDANSTNTLVVDVNTSNGGCVICGGVAGSQNNLNGNITGMTGETDTTGANNNSTQVYAVNDIATGETPKSIDVDFDSGAVYGQAAIAVSFDPA